MIKEFPPNFKHQHPKETVDLDVGEEENKKISPGATPVETLDETKSTVDDYIDSGSEESPNTPI